MTVRQSTKSKIRPSVLPTSSSSQLGLGVGNFVFRILHYFEIRWLQAWAGNLIRNTTVSGMGWIGVQVSPWHMAMAGASASCEVCRYCALHCNFSSVDSSSDLSPKVVDF